MRANDSQFEIHARKVDHLLALARGLATSTKRTVLVPLPDMVVGGSKGSQTGLVGVGVVGDGVVGCGGGGLSEARGACRSGPVMQPLKEHVTFNQTI